MKSPNGDLLSSLGAETIFEIYCSMLLRNILFVSFFFSRANVPQKIQNLR